MFNNSMYLKIQLILYYAYYFTNKSKLTYTIYSLLGFDVVTILRRDYAKTSFSNSYQQIDLPLANLLE